ncbi:UNVERIFIED_CONTAM: hypothetical protein GTU68_058444 [Idotea baltica]|nr:hypothetical protein [Idotea baltica]
MMAWMNREAVELSVSEQRAVYWSRSRQALWRKGEESGHIQQLREMRLDCDADTLLLKVEQVGGIACHTGRRSCFYQKLDENSWKTTDDIIRKRKSADPDQSYVASLHHKGLNKILEKVGEETTEVILAAKDAQISGDNAQLIGETADLWFHSMVMLSELGATADQVIQELENRFNLSGLAEKASRSVQDHSKTPD